MRVCRLLHGEPASGEVRFGYFDNFEHQIGASAGYASLFHGEKDLMAFLNIAEQLCAGDFVIVEEDDV